MSQTSASIWTAARAAVQLPDLEANDLSEPAYASLVYERNCMVCFHSFATYFLDRI